MKKTVYLDNAATTRVKPAVFEVMKPYFLEEYGNASSPYGFVTPAKKAIANSRNTVAELINASSEEIYFTSGGTESDNWAIKSVAENYRSKGNHIITSKIEHPAVLNTVQWLEYKGFEVSYISVDENGIIDLEELKRAIRPETIMISVMFANNEIGSVQPIKEIGMIARKNKVIFHTDAVQAFGHVPIDVKGMKIDLLSASGHKMHGPKGIGVLYAKKGIKLSPYMHGGHQEDGLRAGTYNTPGIIGIGKASEIALNEIANNEIRRIRDLFWDRMKEKIPNIHRNGDLEKNLPNNISITFDRVDSEALLTLLSEEGIYASAGSACTSGDPKPSHVLKAIGLSDSKAKSTIRFSLSDETTEEDVLYVIKVLEKSVNFLR